MRKMLKLDKKISCLLPILCITLSMYTGSDAETLTNQEFAASGTGENTPLWFYWAAVTFISIVLSSVIIVLRKKLHTVTKAMGKEKKEELQKLHDELEIRINERTDMLLNANRLLEQEIAQRKQTEERLRLIFEYSSDAYLIFGEKGIIDVNPATVKMLRAKDKEDILSRHPAEFSPAYQPDGRVSMEKCIEMDGTAKKHGVHRFEWMHKKLDGEEFPVEVTLTTAPLIGEEVLLTVWHDLTERKLFEEQLKEAKELAEAANKAKSQFLANMSHELRTPMNAIMGMTYLCLQTEITQKQKGYLEKVSTASNSLMRIINDILDISKIETGKLKIDSINFFLNDLLRELSDVIAIKAMNKGLELIFSIDNDVPHSLTGDPLRLGQVLLNLTGNAVKFTENGEVHLMVHCMESSNEEAKLKFSVHDTGIGLSREQIDRLFESFTQADGAPTRRYGGTGSGLTISKALVEKMNGEMEVESAPGEYSTFSFTARFGRHNEEKKREALSISTIGETSVLVVDDNRKTAKVLRTILEDFSFKVEEVYSGRDALVELKRRTYKLMLIDWKMPEMDGMESVKRIMEDKDIYPKPGIIMMTASGKEEVIEKAGDVGVIDAVLKPVIKSELLDAIISAFGVEPERNICPADDGKKAEGPFTGVKVLLVEDNEINSLLAVELLRQAGVEVDVADNGLKCLEAVRRTEYDLVLMDIQMPEMDGLEATRHIRNKGNAKLPIVAMTAHTMKSELDKCFEAGMNDHISKPVDPEKLHKAIEKWAIVSDVCLLPGAAMEHAKEVVAEDGAAAFPSLNGIDVKDGLKRIGGNHKAYANLLLKFREKYSSAIGHIKQSIEGGDREGAQISIHTLKGLSGNIGALTLSMKCAELERTIKENRYESIMSSVSVAEEEMNRITNAISTFEKEIVSMTKDERAEHSITGVEDSEKARLYMKELLQLIEERDTDAEVYMENVKDYLVKVTGREEEFDQLEKNLSSYEYGKAIEIMTSIVNGQV